MGQDPGASALPDGSSGLFWYVLTATGVAFFNRAMPTPFLPLVLSQEFGLSTASVGLIMATYPLGALAATSWSCAVARSTQAIMRLHSVTILLMAVVALAFAASGSLLRAGTGAAVFCGAGGLFFQETTQEEGPSRSASSQDLAWYRLATLRVTLAALAVFVCYFVVGLYDATLPQHLEGYVGPVSISTISAVSSVRSLIYLATSYLCARLLQRESVAFEALIAAGGCCCIAGLLLVAPQPWLGGLAVGAPGRWCVETLAISLNSAGTAMMFVPSLPLMQREVRHLGAHAEEQVAMLFMSAMSVGEASGPILGCWLVGAWGFTSSTGAFSAFVTPLVVASALAAEQRVVGGDLGDALASRYESPLASSFCVAVDSESAYAFRRIPFALSEAHGIVPSSAPSASFRRRFDAAAEQRKCASVPSTSWRRPYKTPPSLGKISKESLTSQSSLREAGTEQ